MRESLGEEKPHKKKIPLGKNTSRDYTSTVPVHREGS